MKISVLTRMHYPENHPDFKWRFSYYKDNVLPRLHAQTDKDFEIYIWCEEHHKKLFEDLGLKTFWVDYPKVKSKYLVDFADWDKVYGLPRPDIQVGLDSDDLVEPGFIQRIRAECGNKKPPLLISFQPIKYDVKTGHKYRMKNYAEKNKCASIFAIYGGDHFAYFRDHYTLTEFYKTIHISEGYVMMSIHDLNDSTKIKRHDVRL